MQVHASAITKLNDRPKVRRGANCNEGRDHNVQKQPGRRYGFKSGVGASSSHNLLSHHRFRSRMALPCLTPVAISPDSARTRSTAVSRDRFGKPPDSDGQEYKYVNESLLIASACVRDDDMESVDDQIQTAWTSSNPVSGDRNAGSCHGRNRDQTLVGTGRSPPTARCGRSHIYFCISANP
jgi:hypothetical protein